MYNCPTSCMFPIKYLLLQELLSSKDEEHIVRRTSSKHILYLLPQEWELQKFWEVRTDKGRT